MPVSTSPPVPALPPPPATAPAPVLTPDIEIFRTGSHTDMSGRTLSVGCADLKAIAAHYDPANDPAPIVVGHPTTNGPAYGWVTGLRVEGDRLIARAGQVDPAFANLVRAGRYKKVSACFKPLANGGWALRHVGFLGAAPPAVKGLKEAVFAAEPAALTFDSPLPPRLPSLHPVPANTQEDSPVDTQPTHFSATDPLAAAQVQINDLRAKLAVSEAYAVKLAGTVQSFAERERTSRRVTDQARLEKLVTAGQILPRGASRAHTLVEFLDSIADVALSFTETPGSTAIVQRPPKELLFELLEANPKALEFQEITASRVPTFSRPGNVNFDDPVAIADAAAAHQAEMARRGTPCTSADAVLSVMKGCRS